MYEINVSDKHCQVVCSKALYAEMIKIDVVLFTLTMQI